MNQKKDVAKQSARIQPPLTFDHMFNIYLNPEFIKKLSGKGKQWLSRAMGERGCADSDAWDGDSVRFQKPIVLQPTVCT